MCSEVHPSLDDQNDAFIDSTKPLDSHEETFSVRLCSKFESRAHTFGYSSQHFGRINLHRGCGEKINTRARLVVIAVFFPSKQIELIDRLICQIPPSIGDPTCAGRKQFDGSDLASLWFLMPTLSDLFFLFTFQTNAHTLFGRLLFPPPSPTFTLRPDSMNSKPVPPPEQLTTSSSLVNKFHLNLKRLCRWTPNGHARASSPVDPVVVETVVSNGGAIPSSVSATNSASSAPTNLSINGIDMSTSNPSLLSIDLTKQQPEALLAKYRRILSQMRYEHLVAGITGGVLSTLILHPLDLLKIRLAGNLLDSFPQPFCAHSSAFPSCHSQRWSGGHSTSIRRIETRIQNDFERRRTQGILSRSDAELCGCRCCVGSLLSFVSFLSMFVCQTDHHT